MKRAGFVWLALVASVACSADSTAIVLEVHSDLPPGVLDKVIFHVHGPGLGAMGRRAEALLADRPAPSFPLSLALVRDGDGAGPFTAAITGENQGTIVAAAIVVGPAEPEPFAFQKGVVTRRRYSFRAGPAASIDGGAAAPDAGGAPSVAVDAGAGRIDDAGKTDAAAAGPPDAAVAGPLDAAAPTISDAAAAGRSDAALLPPPDASCRAGCMCAQSCGKGDDECTCENACGCALACKEGDDCKATCTGAGTTCSVTARRASNANLTCTGAATCAFDGRGPGTSNLNATCKGGSQCQIDCTGGVSNCKPSCTGDASCLLRCGGGGNCEFDKCDGAKQSCGGGVYVCNRACP